MINQYYVYQKGSSVHKDIYKDTATQKRLYRQATIQLIEEAAKILTKGEKDKSYADYKRLYLANGQEITSIVEIPVDCSQLVLCKNKFLKLKVAEVEEVNEGVQDFANRIISAASITMENAPNLAMAPKSNIHSEVKEQMKQLAQQFARKRNSRSTMGQHNTEQKPKIKLQLQSPKSALGHHDRVEEEDHSPVMTGSRTTQTLQDVQNSNFSFKGKLPQSSRRELPKLKLKGSGTPKELQPATSSFKPTFSGPVPPLPTKFDCEMMSPGKKVFNAKQVDQYLETCALERSLAMREHWKQQHSLNNRQLFSLFSEFSALMMVARSDQVSASPDSVRSNFLKGMRGQQDWMSDILPFAPGCLRSIGAELKKEKQKKSQFSAAELADYRVNLQTFKKNSTVLLPIRPVLRDRVMNALGVDVKNKNSKVDWETYLKLNKILKLGGIERDDYIDFFVRLFDPYLGGYITARDFEAALDLVFTASGDEDDPDLPGADNDKEKIKVDSMADRIKKVLQDNQVYALQPERDLDPFKFKKVLQDELIDIDQFRQALN